MVACIFILRYIYLCVVHRGVIKKCRCVRIDGGSEPEQYQTHWYPPLHTLIKSATSAHTYHQFRFGEMAAHWKWTGGRGKQLSPNRCTAGNSQTLLCSIPSFVQLTPFDSTHAPHTAHILYIKCYATHSPKAKPQLSIHMYKFIFCFFFLLPFLFVFNLC